MSTTTTHNFDFETDDLIKLKSGDKTWSFTKKGEIQLEGARKALTPKELTEGASQFRKEFKTFAEGGFIEAEERGKMLGVYKALKEKGHLQNFKYGDETLRVSDELQRTLLGLKRSGGKPTPATFAKIENAMVDYPGAMNILSLDSHRVLHDAEFFDQELLHGNVNRLKAGRDAVMKLLEHTEKDPKKAAELAENVFRQHGVAVLNRVPSDVRGQLLIGKKGIPGIDLEKAAEAVKTEIAEVTKSATSIFNRQAKHIAGMDGVWTSAKAKKDFTKATSELEALAKKHPHHRAAIDAALDAHPESAAIRDAAGMEKVTADLASASKSFKSGGTITAEAEKGAKWLTGGKLFDFKHTAETAGKDVEKIGKFRGAKAGILAGMALVTAAIIAKVTDNTGPGKNAESIEATRGQSLQLG